MPTNGKHVGNHDISDSVNRSADQESDGLPEAKEAQIEGSSPQALVHPYKRLERYNERSAMTFMALARMDGETDWQDASGEMYTTREIMDWIRDHLGVEYAANTRETIRRFTLHQFIAGGLVDYNADNPDRPTNSPKNNYRITPELVEVVRTIGTIVAFSDEALLYKRDCNRFEGGWSGYPRQLEVGV